MAAPSYLPEWATEDTTLPATGNTNKVRPKESLRTIGWDKGQIPSAEEFNWLFNNMYLWLTYFSEEITTFLPITGTSLSFTGSITGTATWNGNKTTSVDLASDLDNSTSLATASTLVKRDNEGGANFKYITTSGITDTSGITSPSIKVNGNLTATGTSTLTTVDINGGAIDGTAIGSATASTGKFTSLTATGTSTLSTVDINSGSIDGTTIGATTAAPATVSTFTANNTASFKGSVNSTGTNTWWGGNTFSGGFLSSGTTTLSGQTNLQGTITSNNTNTWSGANTFSNKLNLQSSSIGTNGYTYLPNGLIMQWGFATVGDDDYVTITLPFTFPSTCINVQATPKYSSKVINSHSAAAHAYINSTSSISIGVSDPGADSITIEGAYWTALGY